MANADASLEDQALALPSSMRLRLARRLLSSVKGSVVPDLTDADADQLAKARAEEIENGSVEALDYREEMEQIRQSLQK